MAVVDSRFTYVFALLKCIEDLIAQDEQATADEHLAVMALNYNVIGYGSAFGYDLWA